MFRQYALSFEPHGGGTLVPAAAYVATLGAVVDGLASARNSAAPLIASKRGWPVAHVRECLEIGFAPAERGSLVVPIVVGIGTGAHLDNAQLAASFWRLTARMLKNAAAGHATNAEITASGAESFAKAARFAGEGGAGLKFVQRSRQQTSWATTADITKMEQPLRAYAERRQNTRTANAQLVGQLATLSFDPPTMTLVMAAGRRAVKLPASLRDAARALWGMDVVVDVEASITIEGDVRDTKALAIRAVTQDDQAGFDRARGSAKAVWGSDEARRYLDDLRGRERH
jgi:hypothetical protein